MANKNTNEGKGLTRDTIYNAQSGGNQLTSKHTAGAGRYNVFMNGDSSNKMADRPFMNSRLWLGVPQLTDDQMKMFEAAYTGHQFFFVTGLPKFMTTGAYATGNVNTQAQNLKAIIERCCVSFSGPANIQVNYADQDDGAGRKISHITSVQKDQNDISLKLHEFAGLPVKNAIESWVTGIYDPRSQHGNYLGNLDIEGGWCLANHTMSLLVVQVDPSWTEIQDAAYYCNMVPTEVPFDHFNFDKGESQIVADYDLNFKCNEIRSKQINEIAASYMTNRILSIVNSGAFNSAEFKPVTDTTAIPQKPDKAWAKQIQGKDGR